jgi:hypothetical protein
MEHQEEKGTAHLGEDQQQEATSGHSFEYDIDTAHGFVTDQATIRKGYFYSPNFLGTMLATGMGLASATGGFGLAAPNLTLINADIGPDPNITWVSLVYTLTLAIGLLLVGRLSDLFGRRVRTFSRASSIANYVTVVLHRRSSTCSHRVHCLFGCTECWDIDWRNLIDRPRRLWSTVIRLHYWRDCANEGTIL